MPSRVSPHVPPTGNVVVETSHAWNAVTSPVRSDMVALFIALGSCTVAELAGAMGRPADGLYHHIRLLESADIIERASSLPTAGGRRSEAVYALRGRNVVFSSEPEHAERRSKALRTILSRVLRDVDRALKSSVAVLSGAHINLRVRSETAWLRADEVKRVRELMDEAEAVFQSARGRRGPGLRVNAVFVMTPVVPRGRIDGGRRVRPKQPT